MQLGTEPVTTTSRLRLLATRQSSARVITFLKGAGIVAIILLCVYNLTAYPLTWFDEGSHLHVPKTLVRFGVYADYSSEGFRYYGPTIGVGPTVMLPIAGVFRTFGIGLLQARSVMVIYLLVTLFLFFRLARYLGGSRFAWIATVLVVASRSVALLEYGRELLGEVPGLCFVVAALLLWFRNWERSSLKRLALVGLLLGLAMVTKYQYLLFVAPTLLVAWIANLLYYRIAPQKVFLVPGFMAALCFGLWQAYLILYMGPATATENLGLLRDSAGGAALVFSTALIEGKLNILLDPAVYLGAILPALVYGVLLALPRRRDGQQWSVLLLLVLTNLGWYLIFSIGWWRYMFLGLALCSLFVTRFFYDFTDGFRFTATVFKGTTEPQSFEPRRQALSVVMLVWLACIIMLPLAKTVGDIVRPPFNAPLAMAEYLTKNVPPDVLIETWEPEVGFLTDNKFHYPPNSLLAEANRHVWLNGPSPEQFYHFVQSDSPPYVLVGHFATGVGMYTPETLGERYQLVRRSASMNYIGW
jgi:hypothetical protein